MKTREQITSDMLRNHSTWPMETHLCVKIGQPLGGRGKCGIVIAAEYRDDKIVVRNYPDELALKMYGGPFTETFDSIDALLAAGWVVD